MWPREATTSKDGGRPQLAGSEQSPALSAAPLIFTRGCWKSCRQIICCYCFCRGYYTRRPQKSWTLAAAANGGLHDVIMASSQYNTYNRSNFYDEDQDHDEVPLFHPRPASASRPLYHTWSKGHSLTSNQRSSVARIHQNQQQQYPLPPPPLLKHASVAGHDFNLSILDLQTLRRDSQALTPELPPEQIRRPQQDVFRVHKTQFRISTEEVWFPRLHHHEVAEEQPLASDEVIEIEPASASFSETSLAEDEVEIKLPCRSVSINVVGMPSNNNVNSRPSPPNGASKQQQQPQNRPHHIMTRPSLAPLNGGFGYFSVTTSNGLQCDGIEKEKLTLRDCCRYRKAATVGLVSVGLLMIMTLSVLYWNYSENVHRKSTKKDGPSILDHWGKGAPSEAEMAPLDYDLELRKQQAMEAARKAARKRPPPEVSNMDDFLFIDGTNYLTTAPPALDSRVDWPKIIINWDVIKSTTHFVWPPAAGLGDHLNRLNPRARLRSAFMLKIQMHCSFYFQKVHVQPLASMTEETCIASSKKPLKLKPVSSQFRQRQQGKSCGKVISSQNHIDPQSYRPDWQKEWPPPRP